MGVEFYDRFNAFCNSFNIRYYEQGYYKGDDWEFNHIIAPYNRLYIILDGQAIIDLDGKELLLEKGNAYLIPSATNFSCYTPLYLEKLYCHFSTENILSHDLFEVYDTIMTMDIKHQLEELSSFHESLLSDNIKDFYGIKQCYDYLVHEFIDLYATYSQASEVLDQTPIIQDLLVLIERNLHADLRVSWLAKQVGMTNSTLSKYYYKHMKRKIKNDILDRLMQKAKILLLSSEKSIQEIAYALGYSDALYFSKVFKRHENLTPSDYRKKNQLYYR